MVMVIVRLHVVEAAVSRQKTMEWVWGDDKGQVLGYFVEG